MTSDHGTDRGGPGFDAVLRDRRLRVGLTQAELAARAGIGVRTVRDLERGRASRPQRTTVDLLASALGLIGVDRAAFLAAARARPGGEPSRLRPVQLPPAGELIGRDADADELVSLLAPPGHGPVAPIGPRGVTLVGLAGVGKTSLALAVAHRLAAQAVGVAGIVVTDVSTAGDVLAAVAGVFGVGRPEDLSVRLAGSSALLLVDAVERAPDAVAEGLSRLLHQVPTLRFLATGRHPVGLPGEQVWPLAPLVVPPPAGPGAALADVGGVPAPARLRGRVGRGGRAPGGAGAGSPATALFLERLARVRRAPVEPGEVVPLVALVRRLGGLPLALELAAARGRVLTVAEILDRYGHRVLDLDGPPGAGGRAAARGVDDSVVSVRDAVAASYRLLGPQEQYVLRRLSTFRNRWSLALAELMIDGPAAGTDPVHLLDRLLELGLVSVRGTGAFRFRLLDVVRDFATEQASATGDLVAARRRHAEVVADLAGQIGPDLVGAKLPEAASRLDDVSADLGAALGFAAGEHPHTALQIAAVLPRWWRFRGRDVTGRQWLRRLLDDPRTGDADPAVRAWAQVGLGQLALEHGAGGEEIGSAEAALAAFEQLDSVSGQLTARTLLTSLWMTVGGHDQARRHGEAALQLARRSGRLRDMAVAENNLTWHEIRQGDLAAARRRLITVNRLASRCGEHRLRAVAVANLAEVARLDGRLDEAQRLGRRAIGALEDVGDPNHRRRVLATLGLALAGAGRLAEADEVLAELRTPPGAPDDGPAAVVDGAIALRRGETARAAGCFAVAAERYDGAHDPRDVVEALVGLVASTPDQARRRAGVQRLTDLCRRGGITLLPRERGLLNARRGGLPGEEEEAG